MLVDRRTYEVNGRRSAFNLAATRPNFGVGGVGGVGKIITKTIRTKTHKRQSIITNPEMIYTNSSFQ